MFGGVGIFMEKFESYCERVAKGMNTVAAAGLFFVMFIVLLNIVLRGLFKYSLAGVYEIVQYGLLLLVSMALSHNEFDDGNIVITVILENLKPKTANIFYIAAYIVSVIGVSAIVYNQYKMVFAKYANNATTGVLLIPHWIIVAVLTLGFLCLLLTLVLKLVRLISRHKSLPDRALTKEERLEQENPADIDSAF